MLIDLLRSPLGPLAAQIVDSRLPPRFSAEDAERAQQMADRMSARIRGAWTANDVNTYLPELQRIVLALPVAGAIDMLEAIETVKPGACEGMPRVRGHLMLVQTLARLAEAFRLDRIAFLTAALRQRARRESHV